METSQSRRARGLGALFGTGATAILCFLLWSLPVPEPQPLLSAATARGQEVARARRTAPGPRPIAVVAGGCVPSLEVCALKPRPTAERYADAPRAVLALPAKTP